MIPGAPASGKRSAARTAGEHAIYKNGAKEMDGQDGTTITFMAKWDEREGDSCELDAFGAVVTDWERFRGFERL